MSDVGIVLMFGGGVAGLISVWAASALTFVAFPFAILGVCLWSLYPPQLRRYRRSAPSLPE